MKHYNDRLHGLDTIDTYTKSIAVMYFYIT